jgi:LPXTG-motif cell wall-anchored protein
MARARSTDDIFTSGIGGGAVTAQRAGRPRRRRSDSLLRRGLAVTFGLVVVAAAMLGTTQAPASAAVVPGSVNQCNNANNGGGRAVECDVTVTNYLDLSTQISSSVVEVRTCEGAANVAPTCVTAPPVTLTTATTVVDQCNAAGQGGGATVTCRVQVTNIITGNASTTPATVNQCVGSGTGGGIEPTLNCDPVQSTTNATITQCNGAANGGGDQRRVTCVVEPSTQTSALPVTITQCNNNGVTAPGSYVTCTASLINRIVPAAVVTPSPTGTPGPTPTSGTPGTPGGPTPTEPGSPLVPGDSTATPTPSSTTPASPLVPVAGGGNGGGNDSPQALAETGMDAQPVFLIAGAALLAGGVLLAVTLIRRRRLDDAAQDPTRQA